MTSNRDPFGGFEEKLLGELKSVVEQRGAEQPAAEQPARRPAPLWRRPRVVSVASAGALAIGAVVGLPMLGGESTTPPASAAFDLVTNDDGTITVTIYRFDDSDGLEAQLAEHGVPADVAFTPYGERCQADRYEASPTQHEVDVHYGGLGAGVPVDSPDVELSFTLRPADFQPDETLVIVNNFWAGEVIDPETGIRDQRLIEANIATAIGPVEACELEADPDEPADSFVELPAHNG
jgi:hypothetical protein